MGGCARAATSSRSKCAQTKLLLAAEKAVCLLAVQAKAETSNTPADSTKIAKCQSRMAAAFSKAEAKGRCAARGDSSIIEGEVDAFVDDLVAGLAKRAPNACNGKKLRLAGKKNSCLLTLESKTGAKGKPLKPAKVAKCQARMSKAFSKLEGKGGCATTGDAAAIGAKVDALVADLACNLGAGAACTCGTPSPRTFKFTNTVIGGRCGRVTDDTGATVGSLDCGKLYVGGGSTHTPPSLQPDNGTSKTMACCSGNTLYLRPATASDTGSNRDCTEVGCFFGAPLPIPDPTAPLSTCIINKVARGGRGTASCDVGSASISLPLTSDVFLTGDILPRRCAGTTDPKNVGRRCAMDSDCPGGTCADDSAATQPCPICNPTTLRCNGGPNDGVACVPGTLAASGDPFPTSLDCPPSSGAPLASLAIPFALTTGTSSKTATDLPGQSNVFCGFCGGVTTATFTNPPVPCASNADCASLTTGCGGKGTNPCTTCKQRNPGGFTAGMARTITATGAPAGALVTNGPPAPATLVSVFCIPPTQVGPVDAQADLPGPGASSLPGAAQLLP